MRSGTMHFMNPGNAQSALNRMVDEYRSTCLWFLRDDYYPLTASEREGVLGLIERHGDAEAFRRAAEIRAWLSPHSSETSVVS